MQLKQYTVSDGKLVLLLSEAEEGGYIVTSPLDSERGLVLRLRRITGVLYAPGRRGGLSMWIVFLPAAVGSHRMNS